MKPRLALPLATILAGMALIGFVEGQSNIQLDQFLALIETNHPAMEKETLKPQIEASKRDGFLGGQDIGLTVSPYYALQRPLALSSFTPDRIAQTAFGSQLDKAFWKTGGRLSLGWTSDFTDQNLTPFEIPGIGTISTGPPKFYQNALALTYTQPLLQNFRGSLDRLAYEVTQFAVSMAEVQAVENQEAFLLEMALKFLDWVVLTEQKKIAEGRLDLLGQQLAQIQSKRKANLVDKVDVLRSQDAVRMSEQGAVLVQAQWLAKQAELAVLAASPDLYGQTPQFDLYKRVARLSVEEYLERLQSQSRPLYMLEIRNGMLERQRQGFEEMTKPQLFLTSQISLKSGDAEFGSAFGLDKSDLGLYLQFQYPLGNRKAQAAVRKNRLELRQATLDRADLALTLEATLRNLLIQAEQMEKVLVLNERQIETARERTEAELQRYNQGRGDLAFVIQAQDNEEGAALSYAQNAANYQRINLQLLSLIDEFMPSPDGMIQ